MLDSLRLSLMHLLPKNSLSRLVGRFARSRTSRLFIPLYVRHFGIDPGEAERNVDAYQSLTEFFIRRLKPGLRPIFAGEESVISPVDGVVSQLGLITDGALIQAKGIYYSVAELLGQDKAKADRFTNGTFVTIYLSPKDYHRIHTPLEGHVLSSTYVPGTLFPVNPFGVRAVKGLFARNERLITYLDSKAGLIAMVKVGATIVGSVKVNYGEETTNLPGGKLARQEYSPAPRLSKGEELGRFEFGSTVILLFEPGRVQLNVSEGERVLMGQQIGEIKH